MKDLRILGDRDLSQVALVDNACYSFALQLSNGVPILPFYDSRDDVEMRSLVDFVMSYRSEDVRSLNQKTFRLNIYGESSTPDETLERLFPD